MMAREAELDNMPPEFKAKQLGHMRQFVENQGKPMDPDDLVANPPRPINTA